MSQLIDGRYCLFPVEGADLASDARKLYYKQLVSFAREELLSIPDGYLQHLKSLFFEGGILVDPWIAFRARAPLLICLSAPSISRKFVVETFDAYEAFCAQYDFQLYLAHVFAKPSQKWPLVVERFESIIECLSDAGSKINSSEDGGLRSQYLSLYFVIFYYYIDGADFNLGFVQKIIEYVEGDFEVIQAFETSSETLLDLPKVFSPILSGKVADPAKAYIDPVLLGFLQRYFAKQLPPTLQAIVDGVYAQLENPIKLVDGRVEY
ncbi:hypothetical protein [Atopomonas hussainii]|uniref:hypothetical protein n=1 Tax=Atopomonas hussainii TaxID=1429083 RepID=UPI0008FFFB7F|nr:hypothetical protein [Atopomonas hussainii]